MNTTWAFYDTSTGDLFPGQMMLPDEAVEANTPPGHTPLMLADGETVDWRTQRVDLETGELVARTAVPIPDEVLDTEARQRRNALLAEADGLVMRAIEQSVMQKGAIDIPGNIVQYKQTLRDLPNSAGWPRNIVWPEKPS